MQNLRLDYWESVKDIDIENLVFLDETGILLGLARTHARSQQGTRAYALTTFYRGSKVTAIGAISINKIVALKARKTKLAIRCSPVQLRTPYRFDNRDPLNVYAVYAPEIDCPEGETPLGCGICCCFGWLSREIGETLQLVFKFSGVVC